MAIQPKFRWDLAVDNQQGELTLVVEVKRKTNVSPQWAATLRHNILAHRTFPKAPYFLMVFPDQFYLWTNANAVQDEIEPTYKIDASLILQPYFERAGISPKQISGRSFEIIVSSWLGEIIHSEKIPEDIENSQQWLIESGLYAALAGGHFENEAAA